MGSLALLGVVGLLALLTPLVLVGADLADALEQVGCTRVGEQPPESLAHPLGTDPLELARTWLVATAGGHDTPALAAWARGWEAATADALLRGYLGVAGRLPFSVPTDAAHLPPFDRDADTLAVGSASADGNSSLVRLWERTR